MNCLLFVYKCIRECSSAICSTFAHLVTAIEFHILKVGCPLFHTSGVPYVDVSYKRGGQITIGRNFTMNNGMSDNQLGFGKTPCVLRASNGNITIGENVGISQTALVAIDADITIGDNTLLGGGVRIYTTDFHPVDYLQRRNNENSPGCTKSENVTIGNDCFIGAGATILKGVSIGDRTVVGAGSVVTKSLPPDCVAAGNPCKVVRLLNK